MAQHKASPSTYTTTPSYDVFLSFRGTDTRKNFTDHLYTALLNAPFVTFRDDQLERGENIWEELKKAIHRSRSSVIVFSRDYTSSDSCLDELVVILELKKNSNHVVFPVYYDIGPSELGKEAESLSKIRKCHEYQSPQKLKGWREALKEVVDLAGNVLKNEADGHESKFIQKIVKVIQDKLGRKPLSDVRKELEEKLLDIKPYLDDAEGKQLKFQTSVRPWLHKLKDAVYEAEDLLQEIKTEVLRREMEPESGSSTSMVQGLISTPSHAFDPSLIYPRVKKVLNRLDSIMERRKNVLSLEASAGDRVSQTLQSTSLVEDSGVCGRDDEKETLIKLLLSDDESGNKISVIPIVGMGGIGKTTLAQFLYNDVRVEEHFDIQAWACVSEKFDVPRISQQIYESLTSDPFSSLNLNLLQSLLKAILKGKKFFLVLDDIWNKNYTEWELLMRPFQFGAHGSKIIVTTRDEDVTRMMGSLKAHHLMPLSEQDSWLLFEKHAFKNAGVSARSHLEEIGRQIVQKCKGLPLAIKALAGLLCSKSNVGEWDTILNSDIWESPLKSDILPSLWLSYVYLPSQLKHCFAYCSIFPKNYVFKTSELVYLWMAGDLLRPEKLKTAEEIGQEYFNDLISMSFFQVSSSFNLISIFPASSSSDKYIMHDLINDVARFVSGEFCLRLGSDSPNDLSTTRHFSFKSCYKKVYGLESFEGLHKVDGLEILEVLQQAKCLRTFLPVDPEPQKIKVGRIRYQASKGLYEALPKCQYLRMLQLSDYDIKELPDSINNLKHLKHLDLSRSSIKKLPDTICTLYNMQVLLLSGCPSLTELPANLGRLINLSHLDITSPRLNKMPPNMGKLKDLQMLPEFVLDKHTAGDNLPELKNLQNLRGSLRISGLGHSSGLEAYILRDKEFLKELVLDWTAWKWDVSEYEKKGHWTYDNEDYSEEAVDWRRMLVRVRVENNNTEEREVLEKLQPHLNLERLTIQDYGGKMFPGWPGYYSSESCYLVYLKLEDCENCISLPPLGQLPSLRELQVLGCPKLTGRLASHSFPSLELLKVKNCPEFECFPEDGFRSKLKSLWIGYCKKVNAESVQNLNKGLRTLTSLEDLVLDFDDEKSDWFAEELFPGTLTSLEIRGLNCETIDSAKWFGHLNSLQTLRIGNCHRLQCLPESGLPASLSHLVIGGCPRLQKRCQRETGEDWPKIAHIKHIQFHSYLVSDMYI